MSEVFGTTPPNKDDGTILFDLPMTVYQAKDMLKSAASICKNAVWSGSGFSYAISEEAGEIATMIRMG